MTQETKDISTSFKSLMMEAPDSHLSPNIRGMIEAEWSEPPTAIQILKALDFSVYGGEASDFAVGCMEQMLEFQMRVEQLTEEEILKQAVWRNEFEGIQ